MSEVKGVEQDRLDFLLGLKRRVRALQSGDARQGAVHRVGNAGDPIAPTFNPGWQNDETHGAVSPAGFYREPSGTVFMGGRMRTTVPAASAPWSPFTLPEGFRPPQSMLFVVIAQSTVGALGITWLQVTPAGVVNIGVNVGVQFAQVTLDRCNFRTF